VRYLSAEDLIRQQLSQNAASQGTRGHVIGEKLERDKAAKLGVFGLVDHTHPTTAQLLNDAVVRDGSTDHLRECYGVRSGKSMYGLTAAWHTPPWLPSGWGCRGRRLSRG
jgi:hypothetical protein